VERVFPKRLQKEGRTKEALDYYRERYHESLKEKDAFMSSLYLDEVAWTLIIANQHISFEELQRELIKTTALNDLDDPAREQAHLDIQVTLRKRFPGRFKEVDTEETGLEE